MSQPIKAQTVKIAVDSPADLPNAWYERWNIAVIPCYVNFGLESFLDDGRLTREEFYRRLEQSQGLPTTAAPPPHEAELILADHLKGAEHLVVFTVAKTLSSLHNSIRVAAERVDKDRITVVDSGSLTLGEGWAALAAAKVAAAGGAKEQVLAAAQSTRERTKLYPLIDTLEFLRRGGRVSQFQASVGALLQIKPILEIGENKTETIQRIRTMTKGIAALVELTRKHAPLERLAILHANAPDRAAEIKGMLSDVLPSGGEEDNLLVTDITVAIGTHVGPGAVGIALVRR